MADWRQSAACKNADTAIFFVSKSGPAAYREAKTYCDGCPVKRECLQEALETDDYQYPFGFRGGLSPRYRKNNILALRRSLEVDAA